MAKTITHQGFQIERLTDKNYPVWKVQAKALLQFLKQWDDEHNQPAEDARPTLILLVEPVVAALIDDCLTAKAVWDLLAELYAKTSKANKAQIHNALSTLKMQPQESIQAFYSRVKELHNALISAGGKMSDSDLATYILRALPRSYEALVTSLYANDNVDNPWTLFPKLLFQEARNIEKAKTEVEEPTVALHAAGHVKKFSNKVCNFCNKPGHIAENCHKRQRMARKGVAFSNGEDKDESFTMADLMKEIRDLKRRVDELSGERTKALTAMTKQDELENMIVF